ncbi:MAG: hypothetical protein ACK55I_37230, partial [bacterium]
MVASLSCQSSGFSHVASIQQCLKHGVLGVGGSRWTLAPAYVRSCRRLADTAGIRQGACHVHERFL